LIQKKSANDEMETLMIGKFKHAYSGSYVSKLEGMFNDIRTNSERAGQFKEFCQNHSAVASNDPSSSLNVTLITQLEFMPLLLTRGHWPFNPLFETVHLPVAIQDCINVYTHFHIDRYSSQKLTWLHSLGVAEVKASMSQKAYTMTMTPLQAVVLMAFNQDALGCKLTEQGYVSFEDLQTFTNIRGESLKKVLVSLIAKFKILVKHGETPQSSERVLRIDASDGFNVNERFRLVKFIFYATDQ
jgi:hypothetical protein